MATRQKSLRRNHRKATAAVREFHRLNRLVRTARSSGVFGGRVN